MEAANVHQHLDPFENPDVAAAQLEDSILASFEADPSGNPFASVTTQTLEALSVSSGTDAGELLSPFTSAAYEYTTALQQGADPEAALMSELSVAMNDVNLILDLVDGGVVSSADASLQEVPSPENLEVIPGFSAAEDAKNDDPTEEDLIRDDHTEKLAEKDAELELVFEDSTVEDNTEEEDLSQVV